jgi:hypothetical protein
LHETTWLLCIAGEELASTEHGPIEEDLPVAAIRQEPFGLPDGFVWCDVDTTSAAEVPARAAFGLFAPCTCSFLTVCVAVLLTVE